MEHSRLDFTAAGTANDFFHTFPNYISGKNILSNVFSYAAVAALILLLIIILPCIVRILQQSMNEDREGISGKGRNKNIIHSERAALWRGVSS